MTKKYRIKKISNSSSPDSFFFKLKMHQNPFSAGGALPGSRWGAYDAPRSPSRLAPGGYPLPIPLPFGDSNSGAYGASVLRPP